jgi:hypothetical protein
MMQRLLDRVEGVERVRNSGCAVGGIHAGIHAGLVDAYEGDAYEGGLGDAYMY